jgi:hypothetical protein
VEIERIRSNDWLSMARDVLTAAKANTPTKEFHRICLMRSPRAGMSVNDRLRVADELIAENIVFLRDERLTLPSRQDFDWIEPLLLEGNSVAWELVDLVASADFVSERIFQPEILEEIGRIGEEKVLEELRENLPSELHKRIVHISKRDDSAGYDISTPSTIDHTAQLKLEVKTTCQPGVNFRFLLSRNEFEVGLRNKDWRIVMVQMEGTNTRVLGHIFINAIATLFPIDQDERVKWKTASVSIPRDQIRAGIP